MTLIYIVYYCSRIVAFHCNLILHKCVIILILSGILIIIFNWYSVSPIDAIPSGITFLFEVRASFMLLVFLSYLLVPS